MGRRIGKRLGDWLEDRVRARDGNNCAACGKPFSQRVYARSQTWDHINGDKNDHRLENLQLMHRGCNASKGNLMRADAERESRFGLGAQTETEKRSSTWPSKWQPRNDDEDHPDEATEQAIAEALTDLLNEPRPSGVRGTAHTHIHAANG